MFVHAPYLVNLASPTAATRERSAGAVRHSLERAARLGARAVVIHAGAAVDAAHRDDGLAALRELTMPILDSLGDDDPMLLVEPTAGGGQPIAATVEDLEPLFDRLDTHPRLGVCLDTCHAFAAGHDLAAPGRDPYDAQRPRARGRAGPARAGPCQRLQGSARLQT